ncbi:acyl-ACP--UDP-N-acetylglucosamine O-acyltransferase [Planctomyces sp. SH-PL14]|uniref:acyl-ACP--UDP-N-acetylglucosamine O-acyltransferase n=1 Tax=Planctomyces sp. SH-PL14 TaxID=1632864 RepID=UPI00078B3971|nr:acyl-ACP--UDP-N-acetylglucosamine O-acyltransferase [Planctomyces sp. SH-PL14]AMV21206.1 Acyl-[acyl-carrier-protein]--UDP-N-acetylglucosamine O-acyltransferase [Planctomyces sp. SH-PL14]
MAVHPTAVIDSAAVIDPTASIGAYCVIEGPVRIGAGTVLSPFVHILGDTEIGSECRIHTGTVVGDLPQDRAFQGHHSSVRIGNQTTLRENVTVHRGTIPESVTSIGDRCILMAGAHVGHNCVVRDDVMLVNGVLLGGYVEVGRRAVISGNTGVHQFCRIGEFAMIGGLSKITQDVVPYFMVDGHGLCAGINRVGMRRAGIGRDDMEEAKTAFRILCRTPSTLKTAVERLDAAMETPTGRLIFDFVAKSSKRGFHLEPLHAEEMPAAVATPAPTILPISDAVALPKAA